MTSAMTGARGLGSSLWSQSRAAHKPSVIRFRSLYRSLCGFFTRRETVQSSPILCWITVCFTNP